VRFAEFRSPSRFVFPPGMDAISILPIGKAPTLPRPSVSHLNNVFQNSLTSNETPIQPASTRDSALNARPALRRMPLNTAVCFVFRSRSDTEDFHWPLPLKLYA
jgi:hypothetical protein